MSVRFESNACITVTCVCGVIVEKIATRAGCTLRSSAARASHSTTAVGNCSAAYIRNTHQPHFAHVPQSNTSRQSETDKLLHRSRRRYSNSSHCLQWCTRAWWCHRSPGTRCRSQKRRIRSAQCMLIIQHNNHNQPNQP